jgi:hypothetical protein
MILEALLAMSYGQLMGLAAILYILSIGFAYLVRKGDWIFMLLFSVSTVASEMTFITGMSKNHIFSPDIMGMLITVMAIILAIPILSALFYFADREKREAKARGMEIFSKSLK